jgi:hypothetical protein
MLAEIVHSIFAAPGLSEMPETSVAQRHDLNFYNHAQNCVQTASLSS